jgi:hypothetical protein
MRALVVQSACQRVTIQRRSALQSRAFKVPSATLVGRLLQKGN